MAEKLRVARHHKGWSLQDLAIRAGCTKAHLSDLETGKANNPTIGMLTRIADALEIDPAWLAGWSGSDALDRAIDRMGWPEIHAFQEHLQQDVYEDAGGFVLRKIKRLFGRRHDPILVYQEAARAMVAQAMSAGTAETRSGSGRQPASAVAESHAPESPQP